MSAVELEVVKSEEGRRGVESVRIWVRRKVVLRSIIVGGLVDLCAILIGMGVCWWWW